MKTVLLANEAGHGFGHVKRLNAIAAGLRERGWRTVAAPFRISSLDRAVSAFDDVIPAPGWPRLQQESWFESGVSKDTLINSYAGIAAGLGMADLRVVTNIVKVWDSLFRLVSPVAAVGDFSPGAMIAASGRIPSIAVGNGFTVPVVTSGNFALFREKRAADFPLQDRVKSAVRDAMRLTGLGGPDDPLSAIRGDVAMPVCYRAFDPGRERRIEPVLPPDIAAFEEQAARPPAGAGAYFGPDIERYIRLLPLLGTLRPKPVIALEGASGDIQKAVSRAGLMKRATLFSARDIFHGCRVFIHHGGLGISQLCAAIGVPQLIIFCDTEKWLNAEAVAAHGAGIGIPLEVAEKANVEMALSSLLSSASYKNAALAWREELMSERSAEGTVAAICDRICAAV